MTYTTEIYFQLKSALPQKPAWSRLIVHIGKNHYIIAGSLISSFLVEKSCTVTKSYIFSPVFLFFVIHHFSAITLFITPLKEKNYSQEKDST